MQGRKSLILSLIVTIFTVEIQSAPHGKLSSGSYRSPQMIQVYPEYHQITAYQNAHAPYYMYNLLQVHADLTTGMPTILPDKQTTLTHLPPYGYYYGTPVYDFRFPINPFNFTKKSTWATVKINGSHKPMHMRLLQNFEVELKMFHHAVKYIEKIFPVLSPSHPGFVPGAGSPPISTQRPFDVDNNDDDGIEKLDTKIDPETGMRKPGATDESFDDDDTISVEAL